MSATVVQFRTVPSSARDDRELVTAIAEDDMDALAELFERHREVVDRFVYRMIGADDERQDIVQTAFLEVHRVAARFRGEGAVRTWVLGIAANLCRRHLRVRARRSLFRRFLPSDAESNRTSPEVVVMMDSVSTALQKLSPKRREAFLLCDVEGGRCVDVAAALNVPVGTVYRRLHEARTELRERLDPHG